MFDTFSRVCDSLLQCGFSISQYSFAPCSIQMRYFPLNFYPVASLIGTNTFTMDVTGTVHTTKLLRCLYWVSGINNSIDEIKFVTNVPISPFLTFFGLIGNTLAFIVLGREKPFISTAVLLRALALADSVVVLEKFWESLRFGFNQYLGLFDWLMDTYQAAYPTAWTIFWTSKTISQYITLCIAAERYIAVCRPLRAASVCTINNARIAVGSIVTFSILVRIPVYFETRIFYVYDPCTGRRRPWWDYTALHINQFYSIIYIIIVNVVFQAILPIAALIFFTYKLIFSLRKSSSENLSKSTSKQSDNLRAVTIRVVAVVVIFIILETPICLYYFLYVFSDRDFGFAILDFQIFQSINYNLLWLSFTFETLNSCVNFYVYCLIGSRFRKTFVKLISCYKCKPSSSQ